MSSVLKAHPQLAAKAHPPGALWEHLSPLGYEIVLKRTALFMSMISHSQPVVSGYFPSKWINRAYIYYIIFHGNLG